MSLKKSKNPIITYLLWELQILSDLGFGLDLKQCAVTGTLENLMYVSPKTGRAVSSNIGQQWHEKLLLLPNFLIKKDLNLPVSFLDIQNAFKLTGYFLQRYILNEKKFDNTLLLRQQLLSTLININLKEINY